MKKGALKIVFVVLLCCGGLAQAVPITISIAGNITGASGSGLPSTIHAGSIFTGTYTYDSVALDLDPSVQLGEYQYNSPYGITLSLGGYEFKTASSHTGQFMVLIANNYTPNDKPSDRYVIASTKNAILPNDSSISSIDWQLSDNTHSAFSSTDLPVSAPVLSQWNYNQLRINGQDFYINGTVTQAVLVPEPLTGVLLMVGVFLSKRKR